EFVLVEGIGGLLCPVTETETIADLAVAWDLPLLIVARAGLGTINHTLLTIEGAQQRGLTVKGVLLNETEPVTDDLSAPFNATEIARHTNASIWGVLPYQANDWSFIRLHGEAINLRHLLM
ncbi:MAG: ATP-dependent dethiobiotin synthetase BioD, partial [Planctomycetota bacterium]|nr:ATP-dependent dethiobiotin synthetase BioD [Planctomycetota bacterium]